MQMVLVSKLNSCLMRARTWALVEFSKPMFDVVCILMEYSKLVTYLIKYP